jgi:putative colanic acid biosynthesis acetyltransferase WcaF
VSKRGIVQLSEFDNRWYEPGRSVAIRVAWTIVNGLVFLSWFPWPSRLKVLLLRIFGAKVGRAVVIKPRVNIKYPWRLRVGDHVWIGEGAWIDNLGDVEIGDNACLSQGALLLTGNHDYRDPRFRLIVQGITLERGVWVGARSTVCPGVRMATNSILVVGSTLRSDTEAGGIYSGNPAVLIRQR